jgi:prephenate dehydratase
MRIAFLGPAGTFSHEVACAHFTGCAEHPCAALDEVLEAVVHDECDLALAPFENSNSLGVVKAQLALVAHPSQIFVTALLPHHIKLHLYCWGRTLEEIREVRSIDVVFLQAGQWLSERIPAAKHNKTFNSTAAAVRSLLEIGSTEIAAIGGREAAQIPILAHNIQTEPNVTIFCRVEKREPDWGAVDFVLVAIDDYSESGFELLMNLAAEHGCGISANWIVEQCVQRVGIFEIRNFLSKSRLSDLCAVLQRRIPTSFLVGGYTGKSITQLESEKHSTNEFR